MRIAVQGLLGAAVIIVACVQNNADATRYDNPPTASASVDSLSLSYPFSGSFAGLALPPLMTPKTGHPASLPEFAMFAIAPDKTPLVDQPPPAPSATGPEMPLRQAYAAPVESAPEAKPSKKTPEMAPGDIAAYAPLPETMPNAKPHETRQRERARAGREKARTSMGRIQFDTPTLAPFAHTRFCLKYPSECRVHKVLFRGGGISLTAKRRAELVRINASVNRAIRPERVNETVAGEKWLIAPKSGDCNDYAVTKRHELLSSGWPARSLLLAEVVTNWGEHHLVLVVRTRRGDLVADSLNANIRPWFKTDYEWVRVESPVNPMFWSTVKAPQPNVVAMARLDRQL